MEKSNFPRNDNEANLGNGPKGLVCCFFLAQILDSFDSVVFGPGVLILIDTFGDLA